MESICPVCYEAVRMEAEKVKVILPQFDSLIPNNWLEFSFPAWNVIQGSPFRYFIPADEIDRGLMIQKAKEKREVKDGGA